MEQIRRCLAVVVVLGGSVFFLVGGATLATGCEPEEAEAEAPLEVGYARVAIPWRVGAKPGQVGTEPADGFEAEMFEALSGILPVVNDVEPDESDPTMLFEEATNWTLEMLEEGTEETQPGEYNNWFEPGRGIEQSPDVKATVIDRGDTKVAVVRADVYLMHDYIQMRVADLVEESTGLSRDEIFLVGTHNHSAAQPSSPAPGVWSLADGFDPRHFVYLTRGIARAIEEADGDRREARLRTRRTTFDEVQFNIIGPSTTTYSPDGGDPEEIEVGYPYDHFDDDLDLLYFDEADEPHEPIALIFSLGMHPETLPDDHGLTSGEFPIHTEKHLRRRLGTPAIWLTGALGDIEPDQAENDPDHDFWRHSFDALHDMSQTVADGVEEAFDELVEDQQPRTEPQLRNLSRDIPGTEDYPIPTSAYLEGERMVTPRLLHASSLIRLHTIRLGDVLLAGLPAEVTTDLSRNIKSRLDDEDDEVYQGYVWPDNPDWVEERVDQNFTTEQVDADDGAPIPVVTSMVNGYIGYVVTRWEYENREHYRMHMTPNGPDTADHLAGSLVDLVDEMMGGPAADFDHPDWIDEDLEGVDELLAFFEQLEQEVPEIEREIPVGDPEVVGEVIAEPTAVAVDEIDEKLATHPAVAFRWHGGTNDLPPPEVSLERKEEGEWSGLADGPGLSIHLLNDGDDRWTARLYPEYEPPEIAADDELRFRVEGFWRTDTDGTSEPDPLFDPDGRNDAYGIESEVFRLEDFGETFE